MTRVLIVDDEAALREELQEALELEDFEVTEAEDVNSALALCETTAFDVVVTDLKMPQRGGLELLAELKGGGYPARCFVVSGHGAESNSVEAKRLGASGCLAKPLDVDELIDAINCGG